VDLADKAVASARLSVKRQPTDLKSARELLKALKERKKVQHEIEGEEDLPPNKRQKITNKKKAGVKLSIAKECLHYAYNVPNKALRSSRCNQPTSLTTLCANHLNYLYSVEIKESTIAGAGLGVFATKPLSSGHQIPYTAAHIRMKYYGDTRTYLSALNKKMGTDGPGCFVNDGKGQPGNNCLFVRDDHNKITHVVTNMKVDKGDELLVSYGDS
jgi:hypothetical protein